jgi:hypothetical protein
LTRRSRKIDPRNIGAGLGMRVAARSHDNSQIRSRIEPNMATDQLNEAKRLFRAWRPLGLNEVQALHR